MLLVIEIILFLFAIYRGWFFESLGLFVLLAISQVLLIEFNVTNTQIGFGIEIIFVAILLTLCFFKKQKNIKRCKSCDTPIGESKYSCYNCGEPLSNNISEEIKSETTYIIRSILKDKNDFKVIKSIIKREYSKLGLNDIAIDKEDSLMLKNNNDKYILLTLMGFDLLIETFQIDKPKAELYNRFIVRKEDIL